MIALFEHEQEFFDRLSEGLKHILRSADINTVHDLALALRKGKLESDEAIRALQAINYVYLPDPDEKDEACP